MGFGECFLRWINLIYSPQMAVILIEGCQSNKFLVKREVRQGCPLLPLLFNVTIEILVLAVQQWQEITGITVGKIEHKLQLYVDYVVFILGDPGRTLKVLKKLLISYGEVSGFKVNETLSIILGLNISTALRRQIQEFDSSIWSKNVKYLGIGFSIPMTNDQLIKLNLVPILINIRCNWKHGRN